MGSSAASPHVLIVGGGIGGLFLAQFLRKRGVSFDIFERDAGPDARTPGWAIGLNMLDDFNSHMPDDVPLLRSVCHLLPLDLPSQFITYPPNGMRLGVQDTAETPCVRANRRKLRQILLTNLDVHWGKQGVRVEEDADVKKVTVHFQDGTSATGDLLVGADGTWSKIREFVLGKSNAETLQPVPMAMIFGETSLGGEVLENQLRLGYSSYIAIPKPGTIFFCGLDQVSPDRASASFYWFLYMRDDTAAAPDHWLRTASQAAKHAYVLERVAELNMDPKFTAIVRSGPPEAVVSDSFNLYYDAIIKDFPAPGQPRVVLLGDAAHPTTPFRGEGGVMAIRDALELSDLLAKEVSSGASSTLDADLAAWQAKVLERGANIVQMSRDVVLGTGGPPKGKPRSWGFEVQMIPESTGPLGLAE